MALVYKILSATEWQEAVAKGVFAGAGIDIQDGYIHLSTGAQVRETARLWFSGKDGLLLVGFDESKLGPALKYESSRGGQLFPHYFGVLKVSDAVSVDAIDLGPDGLHVFAEHLP